MHQQCNKPLFAVAIKLHSSYIIVYSCEVGLTNERVPHRATLLKFVLNDRVSSQRLWLLAVLADFYTSCNCQERFILSHLNATDQYICSKLQKFSLVLEHP